MIKSLIKSKNISNTFWNILEVSLAPLIFFISIPLFLNILGEEAFGIWMLMNSIIIIMQVFNFGLNLSIYKHMSLAIARSNWKDAKTTLNANITLNFLLFCLVVITVVILGWGISEFNWFVTDSENKDLVIKCLWICPIVLNVKFLEQIFYNVFKAFEEFKYVTWLSIGIKVLTVTCGLLLAHFTKDIWNIILATGVIGTTGVLLSYYLIHKKIPNYSFEFVLDTQTWSNELKYAFFTWIQSVAIIIVYQGDRLFVSHFFGVVILGQYTIIATLFNHIHMGLSAITPWIFPQLIKLQEKGKEHLFNFYLNVRNMGLIVSILLLLMFSLCGSQLLSFWLGSKVFVEIEIYLNWFLAFQFFFCFSIPSSYFLNAAGYEKLNTKLVLMFTGLNLIGMYGSYLIFGSLESILMGLCVSTSIGMYLLHLKIAETFSGKFEVLETTKLFIPSIFGAISVFFDVELKILFIALSLFSLYATYIIRLKTNIRSII